MSQIATTMTVPVMLACNNYRTGEFAGVVEKIEVGDILGSGFQLALDGHCKIQRPGRVPTEDGGYRWVMRIGRYRYGVRRYRRHVGNICWDEIQVEPGEAARLLNDLRASGGWRVEEGGCAEFEKWKRAAVFTAADFERATRR